MTKDELEAKLAESNARVAELEAQMEAGADVGDVGDDAGSAWQDVADACDKHTRVQAYYVGATGKHGVMMRVITRNGVTVQALQGVKIKPNADGKTVRFEMA